MDSEDFTRFNVCEIERLLSRPERCATVATSLQTGDFEGTGTHERFNLGGTTLVSSLPPVENSINH